jgi:hypothetical protein
MKTITKIALLVLVAIIAIAAARSVDPGRPKKTKPATPCYTQDEVLLLMNENGWSKKEAVRVLEWSCEYPVTPK